MNDFVIEVDSYDFDDRAGDGLVMVFFREHTNVLSRGMEPIIEETAQSYYDVVRVLAIDVEQSPDIAMHYAVDDVPVVIFLKDGKIAERIEGANPPGVYSEAIENLVFM